MALQGYFIGDLTGIATVVTELPGGYFEVEVPAGPVAGGFVSRKLSAEQLAEYLGTPAVASFGVLPATGAAGRIYVTLDTKKLYRWNGKGYDELAKQSFADLTGDPLGNALLKALFDGKLSKAEFADFLGTNPAALDTFHEVVAQLQADEAGAATLLATVNKLQQQVGSLPGLTTTAKSDLVSALNELAARRVSPGLGMQRVGDVLGLLPDASSIALPARASSYRIGNNPSGQEISVSPLLPYTQAAPATFSGRPSNYYCYDAAQAYQGANADANTRYIAVGYPTEQYATATYSYANLAYVASVNGVKPDAKGNVSIAASAAYDDTAVKASIFGRFRIEGHQANTFYRKGDELIRPDGLARVAAKADFTSGSSYDASNWNVVDALLKESQLGSATALTQPFMAWSATKSQMLGYATLPLAIAAAYNVKVNTQAATVSASVTVASLTSEAGSYLTVAAGRTLSFDQGRVRRVNFGAEDNTKNPLQVYASATANDPAQGTQFLDGSSDATVLLQQDTSGSNVAVLVLDNYTVARIEGVGYVHLYGRASVGSYAAGVTIIDHRQAGGGGGTTYTAGTGIAISAQNVISATAGGGALLTLASEGTAERGLVIKQANDGPQAAVTAYQKSRGSLTNPTDTQPGDLVAFNVFGRFYGGEFTSDRALYGAYADDNGGIGIAFVTGTTNGNYRPVLRIGAGGGVHIGDFGTMLPFALVRRGERLAVNGRLHLENQSEPATPSNGGVTYVENGALKYKGSNGTVTVLASA